MPGRVPDGVVPGGFTPEGGQARGRKVPKRGEGDKLGDLAEGSRKKNKDSGQSLRKAPVHNRRKQKKKKTILQDSERITTS